MSIEENRALVWKAYDTTFNRRDPAGARSCYAEAYVGHMPHHPQPIGLDQLEQEGLGIVTGFPDITVKFEDSFGDGDRLVVRHSFVGTHTGPWLGLPPTGKRIAYSGTDIYRFADGAIVEEWAQPDIFGVLVQLGMVAVPVG